MIYGSIDVSPAETKALTIRIAGDPHGIQNLAPILETGVVLSRFGLPFSPAEIGFYDA